MKEILKNGYAYVSEGSVYFDVEKYNKDYHYGKLSGRNLDDVLNTTRELDAVVFRRDYDPLAAVFYGPKLPLEPGSYTAEMVFETEAPAGTALGEINARWPGNESTPGLILRAGQPAVLAFTQTSNKPFFLAFRYDRAADMKIRSLRLTRLK